MSSNPSSRDATPSAEPRRKRDSARVAIMRTQRMYGSLQPSPEIEPAAKTPASEFVEPEPAEPKPAYSGLPLESFPTAKIKKDSLWPRKRKGPVEPEPDANAEKVYAAKLKTPATKDVVEESRERLFLKLNTVKKKNRRNSKDKASSKDGTAGKNSNGTAKSNGVDIVALLRGPESPLRSSKRIKVIPPKKPITTTNLAPTLLKQDSSFNSEESNNDDFCSACGGTGVFICCDTCPRSFHFICCDPPLESLPEDNWNCHECQTKRNPQEVKTWNHLGLFGQLLNNIESQNPVEFQLPRRLRDHTFIDVYTEDDGTFNDSSLKPTLSFAKLNGSQVVGYNYNHDLEVENLYDKEGKPYLCHKCGDSGLNRRLLVHCDYCPLVWHIDCLKDPFYTPKTLGSKWRCPNHIENLLPLNVYTKRNFKDSPVLDVALHAHFMKIAAMNNILIKYEDQPYIKKNGKIPTLQEYLRYQQENFAIPEVKDTTFTSAEGKIENSDDVDGSFHVPEFFQNVSIDKAIVAQPKPGPAKVLALTTEENDKSQAFVYRVPEKAIVLDFIATARNHKIRSRKIKQKTLRELEQYDERAQTEIKQEQEFLEGVKVLQKQPVRYDFDQLVEAALGADIKREAQDITVEPNEIEELRDIKRLVFLKGKEALLQFLHS